MFFQRNKPMRKCGIFGHGNGNEVMVGVGVGFKKKRRRNQQLKKATEEAIIWSPDVQTDAGRTDTLPFFSPTMMNRSLECLRPPT